MVPADIITMATSTRQPWNITLLIWHRPCAKKTFRSNVALVDLTRVLNPSFLLAIFGRGIISTFRSVEIYPAAACTIWSGDRFDLSTPVSSFQFSLVGLRNSTRFISNF